ncbi:thioredoxin-like protein AAED1, chloroplastic isoform X1 [Tasmannia lanceolata]|uniref:thioredoxin-like protein AAED1, chloroplastic isoform X1 n=1 Tax=Tasmannia lanceolata TaxID=3420 RepID=UPI0040635AF8
MATAVRTNPLPSAAFDCSNKNHFLHPTTLLRKPFSKSTPLFSVDSNRTNQRSRFPLGRNRNTVFAISGSSGSAAIQMSEDIARLLESVEVFDLNGKAIPISDLWKDRKAVVAFARHFGCVLCRKRADLLASKKERMDAAGVALVLIGPGSVDQAKAFSMQTNFKGEVYADPSHSSFNALSFVSGIATTFTPLAGLKIVQSYLEGYRQDWQLSFQKDTVNKGGWQQGGILVAGPGKSTISYMHKDKEAGDDPDIEDILKACCS